MNKKGFLLFTRKKNESFYINDNIKVKVISFTRNEVTFEIDMPPEIKIIEDNDREKT